MPPQAPATPGSRASAKQSTITPVKPQSQTVQRENEPQRAEAIGRSLAGKIFTIGAVTPASAADMAEHFSAPWQPTEKDVEICVGCDEWKEFVTNNQTDEVRDFALIQAAVRIFKNHHHQT
jgi:hypothetical protein